MANEKEKMNELDLEKSVEAEIDTVKSITKESPFIILDSKGREISRKTLYETVLEELSKDTRNTEAQINYLSAYEQATAVFRSASLELRKQMYVSTLESMVAARQHDIEVLNGSIAPSKTKEAKESERDELQKQVSDAVMFSNRYALNFAGQVGLALLNAKKDANFEGKLKFGPAYDSSKDRDDLTSQIAISTSDKLVSVLTERKQKPEGEKLTDEDLKYTLECVFSSWIEQFNWQTFEEIAKKNRAGDLTLKYKNFTVKCGEFKRKYDAVIIDDKFMRVKREDIIGNEEYVKDVWGALMRVLFWNEEKRENPLNPPSSIFTFGEPGGGKTYTAHGLIRSIGEIAKEKGIPLKAITFSITDIGSTFKDATPLKLNEIIDEINAHQGPVIMYMPDADAVIPSRENAHATPEDVKLAGVFFSMFDGTRIQKGKFLPIMDANFTDKMGDAIKSRITSSKLLYLKRFSKAEEFAVYAKGYMTKGNSPTGVAEKEWIEIGRYLLEETELNNREISNLLTNLKGDFEVPEDLLDKSYEEAVKFRDNYLKGITKDKIIEEFKTYMQTRMEIDRKSQEDRIRQNLEQFAEDLITPYTSKAGKGKTEAKGE